MDKTTIDKLTASLGTWAALGNLFDPPMSRQRVQRWKACGIPPRFCLTVSKETGIPLHELRPDIYPAPAEAAE